MQAESYLAELKDSLGTVDPNAKRMYGFSMTNPLMLTHSVVELQAQVETGFDLALEYNVPVFFQCDYLYDIGTYNSGDGAYPKYHDDPNWCEWVDWPVEGNDPGPNNVVPHWWNWGSWQRKAAIPCFESTGFQSWIKSQLKDGILSTMTARIQELQEQNRQKILK